MSLKIDLKPEGGFKVEKEKGLMRNKSAKRWVKINLKQGKNVGLSPGYQG
jgi:hypothetical protein